MTDLSTPTAGEVGFTSNLKVPTVTTEQARGMADALVKAGMDPATVEAALRGDGHTPAEPDTRSDYQKDFDGAFAAAAPSAYHIGYYERSPIGGDDLPAFDTAAKSWLSAAGFPETIGPAVIEQAMDTNAKLQRMSDSERELWERGEAYRFEQMSGSPERAAERRKIAEGVLTKGGKFADTLRRAGVIADAGVLTHLALQGERQAARG